MEMKPRNIKLFFKQVMKTNSCWIWIGHKSPDGYGKLTSNKKTWRAHRYSYVLHGKELNNDLVIDHLCKNIVCVNPAHLEQITPAENIRRGDLTKFTMKEVKEIRKLRKEDIPLKVLSERFGVAQSTISRIANNVRWGL